MSQVDQPTGSSAIQALIPELRIVACDLVDGSTISPEDLVQDALLVALRNWHRLPSGDGLKPWLLGILSDQIPRSATPA